MSVQKQSSDGASIDTIVFRHITHKTNLHRSEGVLRELYVDRGLSTWECADALGCSQPTIRKWLGKYEIDTRDQTEATRDARRVERATHGYDGNGYEQWRAEDPDGTTGVYVHQLAAIADGAEPGDVFADDTHCHHRNSIPFDNRGANIEVVDHSQHKRTHVADEWTYSDELGCEVLETAEVREDDGR